MNYSPNIPLQISGGLHFVPARPIFMDPSQDTSTELRQGANITKCFFQIAIKTFLIYIAVLVANLYYPIWHAVELVYCVTQTAIKILLDLVWHEPVKLRV